jgi:hypothetical protein
MLRFLGKLIVSYLTQPHSTSTQGMPTNPAALVQTAQKGDVLLIEGRERISAAIKYLTQSTWSHAALCLGANEATGMMEFVETDAAHGVRIVGQDHYQGYHMRLCRPVGLSRDEVETVCAYAVARVGDTYDVRNVLDLARFLFPTPPVPLPWRRRMIALGSGDPTKAICSTLIAQAFEVVRYPVLPTVTQEISDEADCVFCVRDILHIRHHSLYTPRDFDVSPFFEIIKPTLAQGFDYRALNWANVAPI